MGEIKDSYVVIQSWMCTELELKGIDLLVYALIYGFSQDGESCYRGSRTYISKCFNISISSVDYSLKNLINKGLIEKIPTDVNGLKFNCYRILLGGSKNCLGVAKTLPNNIKINNTNNTTIKTSNIEDNRYIDKKDINTGNIEGFLGSISSTKQQKDLERVDKFLTQYKSLSLPEVRVINDSRKKAILHILNTFSEEDVTMVLNNFSTSDFLLGKCTDFKANIDWILKENNFIKILEGKYNNKQHPTSQLQKADNAISDTYTEQELQEIDEWLAERKANGLQTEF